MLLQQRPRTGSRPWCYRETSHLGRPRPMAHAPEVPQHSFPSRVSSVSPNVAFPRAIKFCSGLEKISGRSATCSSQRSYGRWAQKPR